MIDYFWINWLPKRQRPQNFVSLLANLQVQALFLKGMRALPIQDKYYRQLYF